MYGFIWLIAIVVFLLLEAASYQFICIWFAGGALGALIAFLLKFSINVQIWTFFVVSILLLILTRPFVKKIMSKGGIKTNVETVPGSVALVTEEINNINNTGKAKLNGMEWTARSESGAVIAAGSKVKVLNVEGVKLIVSNTEE